MLEPELKGAKLLTAERVIREVLAHHFWVDQRRGWRYTNPNLEQLGLIEARYLSLDELVADDSLFESSAILAAASRTERHAAARVLFDAMRKGLSIECDALDRLKLESLAGRMRSLIKPPWNLDEDKFHAFTTFMPQPPTRKDTRQRDEELIVRGSPQSAVGRDIRSLLFAGSRPTSKQVTEIVNCLLNAAVSYGIATRVASPVDGDGWRLVASSIGFRRVTRGPKTPERDNKFFRELYAEIASLLAAGGDALFGMEGREHTAQVESELRELREARFRYGTEDQATLLSKSERLKV